ncbi:MAG: redoxin domain-containing protein [Candidatus Latescibacterota bacterium]
MLVLNDGQRTTLAEEGAGLLLGIGASCPDLALPDMRGAVHRLSDLHGQTVALVVVAPVCATSRELAARLGEASPLDRCALLVVSVGNSISAAKLKAACGLREPVLVDSVGLMQQLYGTKSVPTAYVIGSRGQLVATARGPRCWRTLNTACGG